jgi:hypothetical protein
MEQIKNSNYTKDLNTTLNESLNSWFYIIAYIGSTVYCVTKDGQFLIIFRNWKEYYNEKIAPYNYSLEECIDWIQWHYSLKVYGPFHVLENWQTQLFKKEDLQKPQKIVEFITKQSTNNILEWKN